MQRDSIEDLAPMYAPWPPMPTPDAGGVKQRTGGAIGKSKGTGSSEVTGRLPALREAIGQSLRNEPLRRVMGEGSHG